MSTPDIFILLLLSAVFIQDMKDRALHWALFPLLVLSFAWSRLRAGEAIREILGQTAWPLAFLLAVLLLLTLYFSVKRGRPVNITRELLGWGDILFLASVCFYLPVLNYLVFYLASLIWSMLAWTVFARLTRYQKEHIPLAGLQAVFLMLLLCTACWAKADISSDNWLRTI